ncbi:hypothetical protein C8F04DRAFT_1124344 [Mycena alexandri]|uniref:Uncharacterized protein n=1 Tax=Mycena alexandri TaxID=1745969 RepID=A0AAD6SFT0_9AGAR|nr:hypothetical protein C8F04DRAFT_1124344 [Mycena alexandri]
MPRVDTTSSRRTKRDAKQTTSHKGARTAASVRAAAMASINAGGSVSAPIIKAEPVATPIPAAASTKASVSSPPRSWRHPDELPYIRSAGKTWNDMAIVGYLAANAISIPARGTNTIDPWVQVSCVDGSQVILPRGYRLPLLWVAKYQWTSVKLVLTAHAAIRQREWDGAKFEILHIARLCAGLISKARAQMDEGGMIERGWRCAQFDRALHRYWHDWLIMRDEFVRDFFREFGEDEYRQDVLKYTWNRWVLKGHKGFTLTTGEAANGITAEEFMEGLVIDQDAGRFQWRDSSSDTPNSASSSLVEIAEDVPKEDVPVATMPPSKEGIPHSDIPVVVTHTNIDQTITTPTPARVVSFLIRPRNTFRAQSGPSLQAFMSESAEDSVPVDASSPTIQDPPPESPALGNPGGISREAQPQTLAATPEIGPPISLVQHRTVSGGGSRSSLGSGHRTPIEHQSWAGSESAQNSEKDVEMQDVGSYAPEERLAHAVGVIPTTMGSLAPGRAGIRGHSVDGEGDSEQTGRPTSEDDDLESREGEGDDKMEEALTSLPVEAVKVEPTPGDVIPDDLEFDSDLELLYPDQPAVYADPPSASQAGSPRSHAITPSTSSSSSRSASPVPPLSSASFVDATTSTSTELTIYPHAVAQEQLGADPALITRFLQSCGMLGEEMRALRTEVAHLRSELGQQPGIQLDERVRRLEDSAALLPANPSRRIGNGASGNWTHPLQHLISGKDSEMEMDVDKSVSPPLDAAAIGVAKYGPFDSEPLPPRSRKFNGVARLPEV